MARRSVVKKVVDLQEESGNTSETGEARETSDLGGSARDGGLTGVLGLLGGRGLGAGGVGGTGNNRDGGVLLRAVVADSNSGGDHGPGDGARAVGDGERGGRSHRVGLVTVGDLGGLRAVGDEDVNNLGDNGSVVSVSHGASGGGGNDSGDGVLHLGGIRR